MLLLLLSPFLSQAQVLSSVQVYERCFIRMTRTVPNPDEDRYKKVESGQLSAEDACLQLFDLAEFKSNGLLKNRTDETSKRVLKTFHDLHQSWFSNKTNIVNSGASYLIRDLEEPALYYTRAAFLPSAEFKTIVTLDTGLRGIRDQSGYPKEENDFVSQRVFGYSAGYPYSNSTNLHISYLHPVKNSRGSYSRTNETFVVANTTEVGSLVGVTSSVSHRLPAFASTFNLNALSAELKSAFESTLKNYELNGHFGGGILGSQGFIANNVNETINVLPDEYTKINRRLTSKAFEELLCHQLPTLTDADVASEVLPKSSHTFQQSTSCMRCHSSMDGAAYTYRNLFIYRTSGNPGENQQAGVPVFGVGKLPVVSNAQTFALQAPTGKLHYRELVTKTKRSANISSISQLGSLLASHNDIYTCAAKRYYQFFTGINVALVEPATGDVDKIHQDFVLELGKALKSHQSVRNLIYEIFKSDAFKNRNYLAEVEK